MSMTHVGHHAVIGFKCDHGDVTVNHRFGGCGAHNPHAPTLFFYFPSSSRVYGTPLAQHGQSDKQKAQTVSCWWSISKSFEIKDCSACQMAGLSKDMLSAFVEEQSKDRLARIYAEHFGRRDKVLLLYLSLLPRKRRPSKAVPRKMAFAESFPNLGRGESCSMSHLPCLFVQHCVFHTQIFWRPCTRVETWCHGIARPLIVGLDGETFQHTVGTRLHSFHSGRN